MKKKEPDATIPLVVCDEGGAFLFLSSTNRNGFLKSLEQNALWVVNPDTDRLLPSGKEAALKVLEDRETYYYAEVLVSGEIDAAEAAKDEEPQPPAGGNEAAPLRETVDAAEAAILVELADLVARRKRELPANSYTTHLFQSGLDKIRKKTAEEAVELILARKPEETAFEAADLIYHILVLLEAQEIGIGPVLDELRRRAG